MGVPVTIINGQAVIGFDQKRLEQLLTQWKPRKFEASIADASKITAKQGSGITLGAYIGGVTVGSVAEKAGLLAGDIIEFNMRPIANATDLEYVFIEY
jgi:S1-C subfamily serine protease